MRTFTFAAILTTITCFFFSCKKDLGTDYDYQRPVVEGYLVPGVKAQVKVYYQKYLEDTISYGFPITGLKLQISDGSSTVELTEGAPGVYTYGDSTFIKDKKTYTLNFESNGYAISAKTTVPDKPVGFSASDTLQVVPERIFGSTPEDFLPITFSWTNTTAGYYMMVVKNVETLKTGLNPNNYNSNYSDRSFLLDQTSSYQTQQMTYQYLGKHKMILFHINQQYSDALNSSGGSSLNLTNPYTNVTNGLGIFTAMQADTLSITVSR